MDSPAVGFHRFVLPFPRFCCVVLLPFLPFLRFLPAVSAVLLVTLDFFWIFVLAGHLCRLPFRFYRFSRVHLSPSHLPPALYLVLFCRSAVSAA